MSLRKKVHVVGYVGHGCGLLTVLFHNIGQLSNSTIVVGEPDIKPEPIQFSRTYPVYDTPLISQSCYVDLGNGENIKRGSDRHYTKQNKYRAQQHNFRKR